MITAGRLRELLDYDPETGIIYLEAVGKRQKPRSIGRLNFSHIQRTSTDYRDRAEIILRKRPCLDLDDW